MLLTDSYSKNFSKYQPNVTRLVKKKNNQKPYIYFFFKGLYLYT